MTRTVNPLLILLCSFCTLFSTSFSVYAAPLPATNQNTQADDELDAFLNDLTPDKRSALQERLKEQQTVDNTHFGISYYKPSYVLPYYYTGSPYHEVYVGDTPNNQRVKNSEFKGQISLRMPIWENMLGSSYSLHASYTQVGYWQFYTSSQYFREMDYEPEVFVSHQPHRNWLINVGINHQSNGRGGEQERSWNRIYSDIIASRENWLLNLRVWMLVAEKYSSDLHNKDIVDFMGHAEITGSYKYGEHRLSLRARNFESPKYMSWEGSWSYPLNQTFSVYLQGFSGYGQSLIEYDHRTSSVGIGLALSDWI